MQKIFKNRSSVTLCDFSVSLCVIDFKNLHRVTQRLHRGSQSSIIIYFLIDAVWPVLVLFLKGWFPWHGVI